MGKPKPEPEELSRPCPLCRGTGKPCPSADTRQWYKCRSCGMKFTKAKPPEVD